MKTSWFETMKKVRRRTNWTKQNYPSTVAAVGDELKSTGSSSWCCSCWSGDVFAGDVVLLLVVVSGTSTVDDVLGVLSFFLFPFGALCCLSFFIFHTLVQGGLPALLRVFVDLIWSICLDFG